MSETRTLVSFDWAIKNILRDKANYDILEGFLSTLLEKDIKILSLLESETNQQNESDKFNRVDLVVEDETKEIYVIEVQNSWERHYLQQLLYGSSKLIVDHIKIGEPFEKVKKVISISILYFLLGEGEDDYLYKGTTAFYGLNTRKALRLHPDKRRAALGREVRICKNIFPEYYLIEVERFQNIIHNGIDEWIYFFKNSEVRDEFKSKNMDALREKLDFLKMPLEKRRLYERYQVDKASEKDMFESARIEGEVAGFEKGEELGLKKGEELGFRKSKAITAKEMLADGMPISKIVKYTGLSESEILGIKDELKLR